MARSELSRSAVTGAMEAAATELADRLRPLGRVRTLAAGEALYHRGEGGRDLAVIVDGELTVTIPTDGGDIEIHRASPGELVGELASVENHTRTATVRAVDGAVVAVIEADRFQAHLSQEPGDAMLLADLARCRVDATSLAVLAAAQFADLGAAFVSRLLALVELIHLEAGAVLFEEADEADSLYLVVSGRLVVYGSGAGASSSEIGQGELVGELAFLERGTRSATVRARRDSTLARLDFESFRMLAADHPEIALHLARTAVRRFRSPGSNAGTRARSLALVITVPADPGTILGPVRTELSRHPRSHWLTSDAVDTALGAPEAAQARSGEPMAHRLAQYLHQCDAAYDHIVYLADPEPSAWSHHVVRIADCVVFVCSAVPDLEERARIGRFLDACPEASERRWLAVEDEPDATRPVSTAGWPDRHRFAEVHHVRRGCNRDLARLTRLSIGAGTGVVLGGGGARGFAHLGAIRALRESGVEIDRIGGTSMGSIMAALAALLDDDAARATAKRQFQRLFDYTVPVVSLVKAKRISTKLAEVFGGLDIEDLWIPLYCISTNLTQGRVEVHREGDLVAAVRASIAIPGVLPPVPRDGELLVDGGVLNNLPVDVMRADPSIRHVVAVDVTPQVGPAARSDYGMHVSGSRVLLAALGRRRSPYPRLGSVLMRSMIAGSEQVRAACIAEGMIDLYLNLHLRGVGLLEFDKLDDVVDEGYRQAVPLIDEWLRDGRRRE